MTAPRVNDKRADPATGERNRFSSAIQPPWARKTTQISEEQPVLYLTACPLGSCPRSGRSWHACRAVLLTVTRQPESWSGEAAAFSSATFHSRVRVPVGRRIHLGIGWVRSSSACW